VTQTLLWGKVWPNQAALQPAEHRYLEILINCALAARFSASGSWRDFATDTAHDRFFAAGCAHAHGNGWTVRDIRSAWTANEVPSNEQVVIVEDADGAEFYCTFPGDEPPVIGERRLVARVGA